MLHALAYTPSFSPCMLCFSPCTKLPSVFMLPCSTWSIESHVMHAFHSTMHSKRSSGFHAIAFLSHDFTKMLVHVPCLLVAQCVCNFQNPCALVASCTKSCTCASFVGFHVIYSFHVMVQHISRIHTGARFILSLCSSCLNLESDSNFIFLD